VPSLLRNPIVLGGRALVLAVVAGVVVVVLFSKGEEETVIVMPPTETIAPPDAPSPTRTPAPLDGTPAHALSVLTVRAGPSTDYISLGIVRRGAALDVVGKSDDEAWLEISYPPRSQLRGWVTADGVELEGRMASLPVATPESLVLPVVPTYEPSTYVDQQPGPTPTLEGSPAPDLVLSDAYLTEGELMVTVTNQGSMEAAPPIDVAIYGGGGSTLLRLARVRDALPAGASVDLATQYQPAGGPQRLLIRVDPADRVDEMNEGNNEILFGVSGLPPSPQAGSPSPTATLTPTWRLPRSTQTPTTGSDTSTSGPTAAPPTPASTAQSTPTGQH
jgi:hypothetical protein